MARIMLVECMQEISSFNPLQSGYGEFAVTRGEELFGQAGLNTGMGGALEVFRAAGAELVPTYSAKAGSAGLLSAAGWKQLSGELAEALRLAHEFWPQRHRMQGKFITLDRAIAQAATMAGPVLFTDAADATSSGATGDSNLILKALREARYTKRVLCQIVDPKAARAAHAAGVGAVIETTLGGQSDPGRFPPMSVTARVKLLSDGHAKLETMRSGLEAGPTAVLTYGNTTVVVMTRSVSLFDRAMYYSVGINPTDYDLIVVKSPHTEYHMFDQWVEKNFNIDIPGATSANLPTLGHTICARPMYPLDPDATFAPVPVLYARGGQ